MINTNRIVPVDRTDLISLYGLILKQDSNNSSMDKIEAADGNFSAGTGIYLANQPVKSLDFTGSSGTVYFVADYDYVGITKSAAAVTVTGNIDADACTLYKAVLSSGSVTVTKAGF